MSTTGHRKADIRSFAYVREKARILYTQIHGPSNFSATPGWLDNFLERHSLRHLQVKGEKSSADSVAAIAFKGSFAALIDGNGYDLDDVYNADETGLMYRTLPNKTIALSTEQNVSGYKPIKDRITAMACANATGTHRLPLLAIGKYQRPRCLKEINNFPIKYVSQKKAWMDKIIFKDWYQRVFLPDVKERKPNGK